MSQGGATNAILKRLGSLEEIGGQSTALELSDGGDLWLILEGEVDVFALQTVRGEPVGARTHLVSLGPGEAVLGVGGVTADNVALAAYAVAGTHLTRVTRASFDKVRQRVPEMAMVLSQCIDRWLARLSKAVAPNVRPRRLDGIETGKPRSYKLLDVHPRRGVAWVRCVKGKVQLFGEEPLPPDVLFPLTPDTWVNRHEEEKAKLEAFATRDVVEMDLLWDSVDAFHQLVLNRLSRDLYQRTLGELDRLGRQNAHDRQSLTQALEGVAAVLVEDDPLLSQQEHDGDNLLAACQAVGHHLGFKVPKPPHLAGKTGREALMHIIRGARCRTRRVLLGPDWWLHDHGPLVAYIGEEKTPVALIPNPRGGYRMVAPVRGVSAQISEESAEKFEPQAEFLYRPFRRKKLDLPELLRFGLFGSKKDVRRTLWMGLLSGLVGLWVPIAVGILFSDIIPAGRTPALGFMTAALVMVAFSSALFSITRGLASLRITGRLDLHLQAAVFDRLLRLPATFFRKFSAGDLAQRAMGMSTLRNYMTNAALSVVIGLIYGGFSFALLFFYDLPLALIASGLVVVTVLATTFAGSRQLRDYRAVYDVQGRLSGRVFQLISGIAKLRVTGSEQRAFVNWARDYTEQKRRWFRARVIGSGLAVFEVIFALGASLLLFLAVGLREEMPATGAFLAFFTAFGQMLAAAMSISYGVLDLFSVAPIYERLQPILDEEPEGHAQKADPGQLTGNIEMHNISFRYHEAGSRILENVSISVESNQFIALVGPSGSGKSTLLRVLLGFESPERGSIFFDGQDLREIDIQAVREQIGVVLQDGRLMPGDIFSNIVGSTGLSLNDAWDAARMVGLERDIRAMPMGMHTIVSEGGAGLSGGQRQRVLIARAIIDRPRVLIFDEATSALDNRTQAAVSQSIEQLDTTRIVIAHRLSTIKNADRIYVLDQGIVLQQGNYETLMEQEGLFRDLAMRQLA